jgi:RNA polymerase sigma factor (sigma-70 family)
MWAGYFRFPMIERVDMFPADTLQLQRVIDRILAGDRDARRELLNRAYDRLRRLTARILNESFPALRARHDLDSIVHETWLRLVRTVEATEPPTVADFFRLAAFRIRHVLIDLADKQRKQFSRELLSADGGSLAKPITEPAQRTYDPGRLAAWTEFHEKVQSLPDDERSVFEMHFYLDMPQAEIARVLNLSARKVSYLWVAATERLADYLTALEGFR